jgi:uncharacterized protein
MKATPFISRTLEIAMLQDQWESEKAKLLIVYGRRRVGKTRLITHWIQSQDHRALYWVADPTSSLDQLRSFSQALYNFENPTAPESDTFTYTSWQRAFQQIARLAQHKRLTLVLDEFTYLMAAEPGIAGRLQNAWDHLLSEANLFLILSGSHIGMMERDLLSYQAPLYGRATSLLSLQPLPFAATQQFFPNYRPDERVAVYTMLGGIPAYWELFEAKDSLDKNIRRLFLSGTNLLHDEPRLLLQDFISDIHNYVAILRSIANGYRTPKEIAGNAGLNERHISMYLSNLIATGFVERRVPVTEADSSRFGRHHITDPFLRFYFRFLSRRQVQLALNVQDEALEEIKRHLVDFIGTHTWEELCREWVLRAGSQKRLPFLPDQVGSAWTKKAQVDVVGINRMEHTLILGECKWNRHPMDSDVLQTLVEKTEAILPGEGTWRVFFLGFARDGWTPQALEYAQKEGARLHGDRWQSVGMALLDLAQIDQDLDQWTP